MKAIRLNQYGDPAKVLSMQEVPIPEPGTGEVRIRILASPINPSDLLFVRGHYAGVQPSFPSPAGFEGVGIVDALGPQVQNFVPGQRVIALNTKTGGNWAEYAVLPSDFLIPVPDDISDEQAASFFINPASAIIMVRRLLAVPRGEWLLQSAAGSEIGRMIIKLARRDGIRTINVVRRREAAEELKQLGADAVIVSTEGPIDEQVRKIVGPEGVKYAIDPVVGETGTQIYQSLGDDGRMLVYGSLTGEPIRVGADPRFILAGRRILEVFWLGYWFPRLDAAAKQDLFNEIVELMREGILKTSAALKFPLHDVAAAVRQAEEKGKQGKVLLVPGT
ncbi:zinc-dependent alcohol dehydrogenase family protein [Dictyobacter formicarum]|uniref:Trans-2-enoyl-CoA reductase n=1 Tax=Dictyobacter formicarum TaxID=2778368 RepID=A0ABQ3VF16_9CHLR|nr:zinc-dependent alcohol dehydrogenase family protein [Dictyobacter formicarum]GHO84755.1 trans-2-enoyl-CoA reductase [Dictyobacter formicarum]